MQFELTGALIDEILFFMEDQDGEFYLDTQEGIVVNEDSDEFDRDAFEADNDRYISLPDWGPSDGFRLMERFAAGLHNALIREELSAALDRGRGVFRAFKDTLSQYPEADKLWFAYKDQEMKREVISWYNSLRESWGLELIGEEPEDIVSLVLEDFRFRAGTAQDKDKAEKLHAANLCDTEPHNYESVSMDEWAFPGDLCFIAETAGGEFAGYISAVRSGTQGSESLRICAIEVQSEYRGLGLGKALIARLLEQADSEKTPKIIIDLPAGQEHFSRALLRENFKPGVQRYYREGV
jgi:ribosomal protein S18 acetylase RimI-like enzyme